MAESKAKLTPEEINDIRTMIEISRRFASSKSEYVDDQLRNTSEDMIVALRLRLFMALPSKEMVDVVKALKAIDSRRISANNKVIETGKILNKAVQDYFKIDLGA